MPALEATAVQRDLHIFWVAGMFTVALQTISESFVLELKCVGQNLKGIVLISSLSLSKVPTRWSGVTSSVLAAWTERTWFLPQPGVEDGIVMLQGGLTE